MFGKWERTYIDIIKGRRTGFWASILRVILRFFSAIFSLIVTLRNWMFAMGLKKSDRPEGPVIISIGNIVVGGTGKTPATMMLAKEFYPQRKLAFLSRGYRSLAEKEDKPTVLSRGDGPLHSALYCGDEPCIISENFPKAFSFVGKQRNVAAEWAAKGGVELILVDDGMQHLALQRDYDVVLVNTSDPFGEGHMLPRGTLREKPEALERASIVILNHAYDKAEFEQVKEAIRNYTDAPVIGTIYETIGLIGFDGRAIESIEGKKIGIFTSIAQPSFFEKTVSACHAEVIDRYTIPDHMIFDLEELHRFAQKCGEEGAEMLVCTEKDKVKLVGSLTTSIPVSWLKIRMKITQGKNEWNSFITKVKEQLGGN